MSYEQLINRRQRLKRRRQIKSWQSVWRSMLVSGIAGSLGWLIVQSNWVIRQADQITIQGNEILSPKVILAILDYSYPLSLFQLEPQVMTEKLESSGSISKARVTRQLLPPSLTIEVTERYPVAIAVAPSSTVGNREGGNSQEGFLDFQGVWLPRDIYTEIDPNLPLPTLKVIGSPSQYQPHWREFYQAIRNSAVEVWSVDWRNPSNIILTTELGKVNIGIYSKQFPDQLSTLGRMRHLPHKIPTSKIDYIDLTNSLNPAIKLQ
jgi:cell division protein FtsQ